jgi:ABC-type phosphate transport system permease subunit
MGLWSLAMQTVALLGAAAMICVGLGVPLGIWCARSARVYAVARPLLDLMQTMPSLVYLIPAIAFFGTGTPPGIIATIVFGMPPVVRLTALGLLSVPADLREAARAYGASDWQLLTGVELPLALPTIMTGVMLAVARAAGETAPVLFTALFSANWIHSIMEPTASLSVLIYNFAALPFDYQVKMAWSASLILVTLVTVTNVLAQLFFSPKHR